MTLWLVTSSFARKEHQQRDTAAGRSVRRSQISSLTANAFVANFLRSISNFLREQGEQCSGGGSVAPTTVFISLLSTSVSAYLTVYLSIFISNK
jgi:hypothetical protein